MMRKAKAGHVTGGRVFGYDNVPVYGEPDAKGRRTRRHVERQINNPEAAVVQEIFERCAKGWGMRRIAKHLNDQEAPAPRSQQGRPRAWAPSSVRDVLYRPLYRGEIVWNKTRKRNTWGQTQQHARDEAEWLRVPAPELRIVEDRAWDAAHTRLGNARANYLRGTKGRLWGRPADGIESKYLLSGLACCGGMRRQPGRAESQSRPSACVLLRLHVVPPPGPVGVREPPGDAAGGGGTRRC